MKRDLVIRKESVRFPGLFVKKYARRVFYDNLWNEQLIETRGHVETADGKIVINPFTKIFNYGENDTKISRDEVCMHVRKINGFMACATYVKEVGDVVISTTGSLDSDYVEMAENHLERVKECIKKFKIFDTTFIFEIVDENDPHIINEDIGAYLIGARYIDDQTHYFSSPESEQYLDSIAALMGVKRPTWGVCSFHTIVDIVKYVECEGFVVYGLTSGTVLKLKSPFYLALKAAARKKDIMSLDKSRVDEEFYGLIEHLKTISHEFNAMEEQQRLEYMKKYLADDVYNQAEVCYNPLS